MQFLGDVAGAIAQSIKLPAEPTASIASSPSRTASSRRRPTCSASARSRTCSRPSRTTMPKTAPRSPASCRSRSTASSASKGDVDFFKFKAKKDQVVRLQRLRPPPALAARPGADHLRRHRQAASRPTTTPAAPTATSASPLPADGEYTIRSATTSAQGGPDYVYRVEVDAGAAEAVAGIPLVAANSQERQAIVVPRAIASPRSSARRGATSAATSRSPRRTCPRA